MKRQYIFLTVIILLLGFITTLSIYKYNRIPKGITIDQAISQRDDALLNLKIQKALNENDAKAVENLSKDKKILTEQKTILCTQIKTAKLVQPLCN